MVQVKEEMRNLVATEDTTIPVVDNTLSPHGGTLVNRVIEDKALARTKVDACSATITLQGQIAREIVSIAYGFFTPIEGFMTRAQVDSVCRNMTLPSGYIWPIPLVFDISSKEVKEKNITTGTDVLLEYHNRPMAVLHVQDIFEYDHSYMAKHVFGVEMGEHPGLHRMLNLKDTFLGGKIDLINEPIFQPPFDAYFVTPAELRARMKKARRHRLIAYHTRTVPHTGHEWLMKCAWFQHKADEVVVNCVIGEKSIGDCIDECVVLGHAALAEAGYFKPYTHCTTLLLWDTRYAGPREAIMHAIVRKNMGCTGHVFGFNHASIDGHYGKVEAQDALRHTPDLGVEPIFVKEWLYCAHCKEVTYTGLCNHYNEHQSLESKTVCSMIRSGVRPPEHILRNEVFEAIIEATDKYGGGDGYVTDEYLQHRNPIFLLGKLE